VDELKIVGTTAFVLIALRNIKKVNAELVKTIKAIITEWKKLF